MPTSIRKLLFSRIFRHYHSTLVGCLAASLAGIGEFLRKNEDTSAYGEIICIISTIVGSSGLLMAKFQDIPKKVAIDNTICCGNFLVNNSASEKEKVAE